MRSKRGVEISRAVVCGRQGTALPATARGGLFRTMGRQEPLQMSMKRKTSPVFIICFFIEWIFPFPASLHVFRLQSLARCSASISTRHPLFLSLARQCLCFLLFSKDGYLQGINLLLVFLCHTLLNAITLTLSYIVTILI